MIAKIVRGDDFAGLLAYLTAARRQLMPDRIDTGNITSIDTAADEMRAVLAAAPNRGQVKRPVAHIILAWAKEECPAVEQQIEAAKGCLHRLNLAGNQHVIVVHDEPKGGAKPGANGRHFETHIALNRVGFDGRVAKVAFEYVQLECACADVARAMKLLVVPGRFNGEKAALGRQGVGNKIGSIAAQSGQPTLAQEIQSDAARNAALRRARNDGWHALLHAFKAQGIDLIPGPKRRRSNLRRGLVMVDRGSPRRKIKISALDTATEKWSQIRLEAELGAMPFGWEEIFAAPEPDMASASGQNLADRLGIKPLNPSTDIAAELSADLPRMEALRVARASGKWSILKDAFRAQNIVLAPGVHHRRGTESGLVLIDRLDPGRRQKLSALDSPREKWGRGAGIRTGRLDERE